MPYLRNTVLLDRETIPVHTLIVRATQTVGGGFNTATVTVSITDVNDNRPNFNQATYTFSIQENQNIGTSVGTVLASDIDQPGTSFSSITYSISPVNSE